MTHSLATILADATPNPDSFLQVVLSLGLLLSIAVHIVTLFATRRTQKREISFSEEYQPKGDYALKSDLRAVEDQIRELMDKGEQRAVALHNRINPLVENTALIKGQMEAFTTSFQNFTEASRRANK